MYAIGLDLGTTTLSAVALDGNTGAVMRALTASNDSLMASEPWARLMDAEWIWNCVKRLLMELLAEVGGACCIGLTGQMHGIVYVDAHGREVSPLFNWQDGRGELKMADGCSYAQVLSQLAGYPLATGYGLLTHAYNAQNGLAPQGAARICTIMDYVGMRLTGRTEPLMHTTCAASLGAFDVAAKAFDGAALARMGIDPALLPPVTGDVTLLGCTVAEGLIEGIPVAVAIGDNQASFMGSVNQVEDGALVNMGTGGQVSVVVDRPATIPGCEVRPYADGRYLLTYSSLCGGRAYQALERFLRDVAVMAGAEDRPLYAEMRALLAAGEPEDPPLVDTRFSGTRDEPSRRGAIQSLSIQNFTPQHLVQGTLNGMASELCEPFQLMREYMTAQPDRLIGSGNGIRQNVALRRVLERAFELPLWMPQAGEEAACGAALFALVAAGIYRSLRDAQAMIRYEAD